MHVMWLVDAQAPGGQREALCARYVICGGLFHVIARRSEVLHQCAVHV